MDGARTRGMTGDMDGARGHGYARTNMDGARTRGMTGENMDARTRNMGW